MTACAFGDATLKFPVKVHFRVIAYATSDTDTAVRAAAAALGIDTALTPGNVSAPLGRRAFWQTPEQLSDERRSGRACPGIPASE